MFTHVMLGANDPQASIAFYEATFAALGVPCQRMEDKAFFGTPETGMFGVGKPLDGQAATIANGGTVGLKADSIAAVDLWHKAGLENGGTDEGAPGRRDYSEQPMYGAYLRDPVGNKLCVFTTNMAE